MSTYKEALNEYENEDENGKLRLIYTYFGLSIYFIQVIEETFSIMLWTNRIFKKKVKSNREVNEIIDSIENSKKTMGPIINEIKQSYALTSKTANDLKQVLEKRNYLVHKYFKFEIQKCYSELGRKEMLQFFGEFIDQSRELDSELNNYFRKYTDKLGLTKEKIEEIGNQMKKEEMHRNHTTANNGS